MLNDFYKKLLGIYSPSLEWLNIHKENRKGDNEMFGRLYIPVAQENSNIGLISFKTFLDIENLETLDGFAKLYVGDQLIIFDTFDSINGERYKVAREVFYREYLKDTIDRLKETNDELRRKSIAFDVLMKIKSQGVTNGKDT